MDRNVDKLKSEKSLEMIEAGGQVSGNSGPTGSARTYPKGGIKASADFNPMRDSKRGATGWVVGGV